MYKRELQLGNLLAKKSFFLFGPRSTGKTTLIQQSLKKAQVVDLLHSTTFSTLLRNPSALEEMILQPDEIVVIDEVQKLPEILDEVQRLIQKKNIRFLLTGSSARKLKHGGANLLAGRAREARLFPLTSVEIPQFDLLKILNQGGLPAIYDSDEPEEDLEAYVDTYLREEIKAEAVTRNVAAFAEFLDAIALSNGQEINFESMASDLQVSPGTLKNYFQILEDTLIGFSIPGFTQTKKRKAISRAKHYLFDLGVCRYLAKGSRIQYKSKAFGEAFEHFIILELRAYLSYRRLKHEMSYWRTTTQFEVDLILGKQWAIEIKSTDNPTDKSLKGLRALMEERICKDYFLVCLVEQERKTKEGIRILPWKRFLELLWRDEIVG